MKSKLLILAVAVFVALQFTGCSDSGGRTGQKFMGLNGDIESVKDTGYFPGTESGATVPGGIDNSVVHTFNVDGKKIGQKMYDARGTLMVEMENVFENGKMVAGVTKNYLLGEPIISESVLVKRSRRSESWEIRVDGFVSSQNIEFRDRGAHVVSVVEDPEQEVYQKTEERYDANGNQTEYKAFGKNGLLFWYKYFYDDNGRMVKSLTLPDEDGGDENAKVTTYKYTKADPKGNWTEMVVYDEHGAPIRITEREIVYR